MNSVSWFIYIAQVTGSIGAMLMFFGIATVVAALVTSVVPRFYNVVEGNVPGDKRYWTPSFYKGWLAFGFVLLLLGNLMPERNTMYAIAASQVGEKIITSEKVQGVADDASTALHSWIKKQIEPTRKSGN